MKNNSVRSIAAAAVLSLSAIAFPQIASATQAPPGEHFAQNIQHHGHFTSDRTNGVRGPHGHCGVGCLHEHNGG